MTSLSTSITVPHCKPSIDEADIAAVEKVLRGGQIACGSVCRDFEQALAEKLGWRYACVVSSGTAALTLAMGYVSVAPMRLWVSPYNCPSIRCASEMSRTPLLFGKTSMSSWCLGATEQRTDMYRLHVHTYGVVDTNHIDAYTIEDATMSLGSAAPQTGHKATCSVVSFYATKMLCTGEGGVILSNSEPLIGRCRDARDCRSRQKQPQGNFKMTDAEAAMGLSQLSRLDSFIERRAEIACRYNDVFFQLGYTLPPQTRYPGSVYGRYVIRVGDRDVLRRRLLERGVECGVGLDSPLSSSQPFDVSLCQHTLSLPIYPGMSDADVQLVIDAWRGCGV